MALERQREDLSRHFLLLRDRELRRPRPGGEGTNYRPLLNDHQPMAPAHPPRRPQIPGPLPRYHFPGFEVERAPIGGDILPGFGAAIDGRLDGFDLPPPRYPEFAEFLAWPARHNRHIAEPTGPGLALGAVCHVTCTICGDELKDIEYALPLCRHPYCGDCIKELFTHSFLDEQLFPPQCCHIPIPIASVKTFLTPEIEKEFATKSTEYKTKNRIYCANRKCGVFVSPAAGATSLECSSCKTKTCIACKNEQHEGECPKDEAAEKLEALVKKKGWKRCPNCSRVIELQDGCNHIT